MYSDFQGIVWVYVLLVSASCTQLGSMTELQPEISQAVESKHALIANVSIENVRQIQIKNLFIYRENQLSI